VVLEACGYSTWEIATFRALGMGMKGMANFFLETLAAIILDLLLMVDMSTIVMWWLVGPDYRKGTRTDGFISYKAGKRTNNYSHT
jgi:hypothetical protein